MRLRNPGYTLVGVLVAMVLGSSLFAAGASFVGKMALRHMQMLLRMQATEQLDATLMLIRNELRRSGYAGMFNSQQISNHSPNAFTASLRIEANPDNLANRCILFSYDKNHNGHLDTVPSESMGFRVHNKSIEMRMAQRSCQQSGWQDITDKNLLNITDFQVHFEESSSSLHKRLIITVEAQVNGSGDILHRERVIPLENYDAQS